MKINSINRKINFSKICENKKSNPKNTVTISGSSSDSSQLEPYNYNCLKVTKELVLSEKNI